jgi:hypothetical protein
MQGRGWQENTRKAFGIRQTDRRLRGIEDAPFRGVRSAASRANFLKASVVPQVRLAQGGQMSATRNPGRFAGLLYLLASIPGVFALIYVPSKLIVHGNATATAHNIAASELLFRLGIAANLIGQAGFIFVALALYDLLKGVNQRRALLMVTLIVVSIPIAFLNELNAIAALVLVRGADFLSLFDRPQRDALAMLFLNLHGRGFDVAGIFWGLWLFPLGLLVYRSSFLPRILGIVLMVNCFAYPVNSFTSLVLPQYEGIVSQWTSPLQFGELVFMLWLLIMGAKPKPLPEPAVA